MDVTNCISFHSFISPWLSYELYFTQSLAMGAESIVSVMPNASQTASECGPTSEQSTAASAFTSVA